MLSLLVTVVLIPTGLEHSLAKWVHQPDSGWAWWVRQYGFYPAAVVTLLSLFFLLLPWWRKRFPVVRQLAVVWLITALFGAGLFNQVILNELVDRARPRDSILVVETAAAALQGNSFPSGHAAIGFVFVAPFFIWWQQRRRKLALVTLVFGLLAGFGIGYSRMVLGAHFFTDVMWAGTLCIITAVGGAYLYRKEYDVPTYVTGGLIITTALCMVLFNSFKMTLTWRADKPLEEIVLDLPCESFAVLTRSVEVPQLSLELSGFGAPLSNLVLVEEDGVISLRRWKGIYHSLECQHLKILAPVGIKVRETS